MNIQAGEIRASQAAIKMAAATFEETTALLNPDNLTMRIVHWQRIHEADAERFERYAQELGVSSQVLLDKGAEFIVAKDVALVVARARKLREQRQQASQGMFNPYR